MASALSPFASSKETTNYARLCCLWVDVGSQTLKDTFDKIHPPARLHAVLTTHLLKTTLQSLYKGNWSGRSWILPSGESCTLLPLQLYHQQTLMSLFWLCCWGIYVVWVLSSLAGTIFPQLQTRALQMTSPELNITEILCMAMPLMPLSMTEVLILTGRKSEIHLWGWIRVVRLILTNWRRNAWTLILMSIIVKRKTTAWKSQECYYSPSLVRNTNPISGYPQIAPRGPLLILLRGERQNW